MILSFKRQAASGKLQATSHKLQATSLTSGPGDDRMNLERNNYETKQINQKNK